jgi:hypothetical protein
MKYSLACLPLLLSLGVHAAPNPQLCDMVGSLALRIAQDRDAGMPYKTAVQRHTAAAAGMPPAFLMMSKSAINTVYLEQPKITPDGAYGLHFQACMAAK